MAPASGMRWNTSEKFHNSSHVEPSHYVTPMNITHTSIQPSFDREHFVGTLRAADLRWQQRKEVLEALRSSLPILLFGFGGKGQMLAQHIKKHAKQSLTVYDISPEKRQLARTQGFTVLDSVSKEDLSKWAVILGACQAQQEQKEHVGKNYIYFQEAAYLFEAPHLENLARDFQHYVLANVDALFDVTRNLSLASQRNMLAVLAFRLSLDPSDLTQTRKPNSAMWLDVPTQLRQRAYDTFLDVGAFDGDTLQMFQDKFDCQRGIAVEANASLFDAIRMVGSKYPKSIDILPMAAWSKRTHLNFEEVRFGMIKVTEDVQGMLQAAPIDDFVSESVDVVKMDIEGAESKALEGCSKLLKSSRPDLAIAAYHRPEDFVDLYSQLGNYGYHDGTFEWSFAHYSDCLDDSIFYVTRKN